MNDKPQNVLVSLPSGDIVRHDNLEEIRILESGVIFIELNDTTNIIYGPTGYTQVIVSTD